MKIIIDTNILLSAMIKDATTRMIITHSGWDFYYPESAMQELRKHKDLVLMKSGMSEDEYEEMILRLLKYVKLIPLYEIEPNLEESQNILGKIDPDDCIFLAAAISYSDSIIWSEDSDFDKQDRAKNLKTKEIVTLYYS